MHACMHAHSNRTVHLKGQLRLDVQCTTPPYVHYTSILLTIPTILYTFSFLLYVHTSSMLHTFPSLLSTYLLPSNLLTLRSILFLFPHILPTRFLLYCTRFPLYSLHCYNRKVCLPLIPGEGAVSFMTVWFFPHKNFAISRG